MDSLGPMSDPTKFDHALEARTRAITRRARKAAHELTLEGWNRSPEDQVPEGFSDPDERTLVTQPDPVLYVRAARDALSKWLDDAARKAGGQSKQTPPGWPYETWPS
jgi:hypothetical protein